MGINTAKTVTVLDLYTFSIPAAVPDKTDNTSS
jgi:hypothetical protein